MDDFSISEVRNDLSWLEGTILSAMRSWVLGCRRGVSADVPIQTIFANLRAPEATQHLNCFMRGLSQGCTRMIKVYCTCEPLLSADEVLLLDTFAMMQEEMHDGATSLLQRFATPAAAYEASGHALAIVQILNAAGHVLARGPAAVQRHAQSADDPIYDIGTTARLH